MKNFNYKQYLKEGRLFKESQSVQYKGKTYYTENPEGKSSVFAYTDKDLKQVAKVNGKTLKFNTKDLEDKLIKESFNPKMRMSLPFYKTKIKDASKEYGVNYEDIEYDDIIDAFIKGTSPIEFVKNLNI